MSKHYEVEFRFAGERAWVVFDTFPTLQTAREQVERERRFDASSGDTVSYRIFKVTTTRTVVAKKARRK